MKKKTSIPLLLFLLLGLFSFFGCSGGVEIAGIHMSNPETVQVYYGNFSYEGINVTVDFRDGSSTEIPLREEMISEIERLKFFKMGQQEVNVVYRNRYTTKMPIEVIFNQFKDSYALVGYECVYDGKPHAVTVNQELPEGATISYPYGNIFTNAGKYEVVGVMEKNGYESKTMTTTLTIHPAKRDGADDIFFLDFTCVYNGEMRTIEATNVPEGVEVSYDIFNFDSEIRINKAVNAGKYRVVAHFTDTSPNYEKIEDKEAILTIQKAHYDVSTIELLDAVKEYDGYEYEASITNKGDLPTGLSVEYSYLNKDGQPVVSNANAGTYTMVAKFVGMALDNYYPIEPLTATLTVSPRVIKISDKITFESATVNFDENVTHSLEIKGELPESVTVTYENNDKVYAGEYAVIAHFAAKNANETVDVEEMKAYLTINRVRRSVKVYNEETEAYDLPFSAANIVVKDGLATIEGIDDETFRVAFMSFYDLDSGEIVKPNELVNGTMYKYSITFEYIDSWMNQSVILSEESDTFTYIEA